MIGGQARHARYYLDYCQAHPEDLGWFVQEWPQIQRAWQERMMSLQQPGLDVLPDEG